MPVFYSSMPRESGKAERPFRRIRPLYGGSASRMPEGKRSAPVFSPEGLVTDPAGLGVCLPVRRGEEGPGSGAGEKNKGGNGMKGFVAPAPAPAVVLSMTACPGSSSGSGSDSGSSGSGGTEGAAVEESSDGARCCGAVHRDGRKTPSGIRPPVSSPARRSRPGMS